MTFSPMPGFAKKKFPAHFCAWLMERKPQLGSWLSPLIKTLKIIGIFPKNLLTCRFFSQLGLYSIGLQVFAGSQKSVFEIAPIGNNPTLGRFYINSFATRCAPGGNN